ncbi:hypothetical protein NQ315_005995 [Exocentrus adspersus]|uniref:Uncharacterized protein n=1 Tax=Exocentrus adspersus TaxID=1586481 RepID=A0AAV8VBT5_9CUCU|nr:hypothetical protein NQ315_005995 [Exocentrus adspersus]
MTIVMIVGIAGAWSMPLTRIICDLNVDNVQDMGNVVLINISDYKNGTSRRFTITADKDCSICHLAIFKKYSKTRYLIEKPNQRFFFETQFLKLPNAEGYTGYSFRRTSPTLLANTGASVLALKRHWGWKSETVAESYVVDCLHNKNEVANKILYNKNTSNPGSSAKNFPNFPKEPCISHTWRHSIPHYVYFATPTEITLPAEMTKTNIHC